MRTLYKKIFLSFFKNKDFNGSIKIETKGKNYIFGDSTDFVNIKVIDENFFKRVINFGDIGFGEAFFNHEFETRNLKKLLLWFIKNKDYFPGNKNNSYFFDIASFISKFSHFKNKNTKKGSKRNIKKHYDLSNKFYRLWLDKTMTYSSGVFEKNISLQKAQERKYQKICEKLSLKKTDRVLEIGSGWGGFAIYAAKKYGCKINTLTISEKQYKYAKRLIKKEGLQDLVNIELKDYRDVKGKYDKIVSIEMMEALGHKFVALFIKKCNHLLKSGGKICFQCITYPDKDYQYYLKNPDFINKHIFPGGELLSLSQIKKEAKKNSLNITGVESIGTDYAKTLNLWKSNFLNKKDEIKMLGFDEKFIKKWVYYFTYCEVGFETKYIDDVQIAIDKTG